MAYPVFVQTINSLYKMGVCIGDDVLNTVVCTYIVCVGDGVLNVVLYLHCLCW